MASPDRLRSIFRGGSNAQPVGAPGPRTDSLLLRRLRSARKLPLEQARPSTLVSDDPETPTRTESAELPSDYQVADNATKEAAAAPVEREKKPNPYRLKRLDPLRVLARLSKDFSKLEWAKWVPEALWHAIVEKYGSEPTGEARNIIGALRSVLHSEAFWIEPHVFLWTAAALNQRAIDLRIYPELDPEEVMYAVAVVAQIRDKEPMTVKGKSVEGVEYSHAVLATIAAIFLQQGLVYVPPPVDGANQILLERMDGSAHKLHLEVKAAWAAKGAADPVPSFPETAFGLQMRNLFAIREYIKGRTRA